MGRREKQEERGKKREKGRRCTNPQPISPSATSNFLAISWLFLGPSSCGHTL